jgi:hypothetical protein
VKADRVHGTVAPATMFSAARRSLSALAIQAGAW